MIEELKYHKSRIIEVVNESPKVKSIILKTTLAKPAPGQFVMVWVPGIEEIPISPSYYSDGIVRLTIARVGDTTNRIHHMKSGDVLMLRGPHGRGFNLNLKGRYLLVAGGYGAAPLIYALRELVSKGRRVAYAIGARTREELLFIEEARNMNVKLHIATEDGSEGYRGFVTELVEEVIEEYDNVLACGPELMLFKIMNICLSKGIKCQLSIERFIKCGLGICGSCALEPSGLRVCRDGPVFYAEELKGTDFGRYYTLPSGIRVRIEDVKNYSV